MAVLLELLAAPGEMVRKEELLRRVWSDDEVGEHVLTTAIYRLRKLLEATGGQRPPVETVPRRGYLLAAAVEPEAPRPPLAAARVEAARAGAQASHRRAANLLAGPRYEQIEEGIRQLEAATRLWPDFAQAHADLARGYFMLACWGRAPGGPLLAEAAAAAWRSFELDPALTAARVWCAMTHLAARWRPAEAATAIEAALLDAPDDAPGRDALAHCLAASGRLAPAIREQRRALALDPLAPAYHCALGCFLRLAGRLDEAEAPLRRALELAPAWSIAHLELGRVLLARGDRPRAAREIARAERSWGRFLQAVDSGDAGAAERARRRLSRWLAATHGRYQAPYWLAERCMWAGRFDAALDQLERAHREGQMQLLYVASDPAFRPLRGTPRYRRLLAALRAPPAGRAPGRAPGGPAGSP
ncbi:MAG: hypothetical protein H6Q03_2933 [Acidobacteria bacterium]|nr:hypothetical protein [Acidobacteriota bacterium]